MATKKEEKKLTKDQANKKVLELKKDLFNIRFKKVNNQINNPAQYNDSIPTIISYIMCES